MSDCREYSPPRGGQRYSEWSDEEYPPSRGREKFRSERGADKDRSYLEDYERRKRSRHSPSPPEDRRYSRRRLSSYSPEYRGPSRSRSDRHSRGRERERDQDGDHYIPNYDRDGYAPAPKYSQLPENTMQYGYPDMQMLGWQGPGASNPTVDPSQLDYLITFKQYCDYIRSTNPRTHFDDDEYTKKYTVYKEKFNAKQLATFFEQQKDKEWFQEKYHPSLSKKRKDELKQLKQRYYSQYLIDLENGKYDDVRFDEPEGGFKQQDTPMSGTAEGEASEEWEPRLIIKTVPPTIPRNKIVEMCEQVEGFDYLALSEPTPAKKFHRLGWINFKEGTDIKAAFDKLDNQKIDDFTFHLAMNKVQSSQNRVPRHAPEISNTTERIKLDLERAKQVAKTLESELGDNINGLELVEVRAKRLLEQHDERLQNGENEEDPEGANSEEKEERWKIKRQLDIVLTYLRNAFMFCYYCGLECESFDELGKKCVEPHYRKSSLLSGEGSGDPKDAKRVARWAENLDQKIDLKINTPDDRTLEKMGGKVLQKELEAYVEQNVLKEHDAKFKCKVKDCKKAFKGYGYVEKHIHMKHPEEVEAIKAEVEFFNNYVLDPNHLLPTSGQQGLPTGNVAGLPINPSSAPPFMMGVGNGMRIGGSFTPVQAAVMGTPWNQIPRIGFNEQSSWSAMQRRGSRNSASDMHGPGGVPSGASLDMPKDPRQVTSYVDLDAPAEGDSEMSFL
ncbi:unnamed protein product [Umbelopsis ramanniana]